MFYAFLPFLCAEFTKYFYSFYEALEISIQTVQSYENAVFLQFFADMYNIFTISRRKHQTASRSILILFIKIIQLHFNI